MAKIVGRHTTKRASEKAGTASVKKAKRNITAKAKAKTKATKATATTKTKKRQAKTPLLPVMVLSGSSAPQRVKAATMLAKELKSPLHRVDLHAVVSHDLDETEKNFIHMLEKAERSDAILFFDQIDELLEKRRAATDSHDCLDHLDVTDLLLCLEHHEGLTILATNQRGPLDKRLQKYLHVPLGPIPVKKPGANKKSK